MDKLPGDYIAGFVDGEGCFALKFRRDIRRERKNVPIYFYWDLEFAIVLNINDTDILYQIQKTLECGTINSSERGYTRFSVKDHKDIRDKVVPFFSKYSLRAKKKFDFELWKEAVKIFDRNQRTKINVEKGKNGFQKVIWNSDDIERLKAILQNMKNYKGGTHSAKWLQLK